MGADKERRLRIESDLNASADDLLWLKEQDPIAALSHPNCPAVLWWQLAAKHPLEAQASVLYRLIMLESPERWRLLEEDNIDSWIRSLCERLTPQKQSLFAADCVERVLNIFEQTNPDDSRPREAVCVRRLWAYGEATEEQLVVALTAAGDAAVRLLTLWHAGNYDKEPAFRVAAAVAQETAERSAREAAQAAEVAALLLTQNSIGVTDPIGGDLVWGLERQWQWKRLQQYLRGEVNLTSLVWCRHQNPAL
jgi:hypothetical protein